MNAFDLWRDHRSQPSLLDDVWSLMNDFDKPRTHQPHVFLQGRRERFHPACDVQENEEGYLLSFDVPGVKKDDLTIEVKGRQLIVSGERREEEEVEGSGTYRRERSFGRFQRAFSLPEHADGDQVQASHEDGVLHVAIPKVAKAKPRKIDIKPEAKGLLQRLAKSHKSEG